MTDLLDTNAHPSDTVAPFWPPEEINQLVSTSGNPAETLSNVVQLIHQRFATNVCCIYLLESNRANLVLVATVGLRQDSVGRSAPPTSMR